MLRVRTVKNQYYKRLIRPLYAQTQATPYAAVLDSTLRDPTTKALTLPGAAFKLLNGLVPGTVMTARGDAVLPATGANPSAALFPAGAGAGPLAFGLLANFVGGELDDIGDENYVGVWRGPDAVFEILAPGFNDDALSTAWDASTSGLPVQLFAGIDGRLSAVGASTASGGLNGTAGNRQVVAHLIERPNSNRIVVDLKV
jgi:hypothetical protein